MAEYEIDNLKRELFARHEQLVKILSGIETRLTTAEKAINALLQVIQPAPEPAKATASTGGGPVEAPIQVHENIRPTVVDEATITIGVAPPGPDSIESPEKAAIESREAAAAA